MLLDRGDSSDPMRANTLLNDRRALHESMGMNGVKEWIDAQLNR
jgi:hypothetical protein